MRDERESRNQGCWSLVWLGTMSMRTRMPRSAGLGDEAVEVVQVPNSGAMAQKSETS